MIDSTIKTGQRQAYEAIGRGEFVYGDTLYRRSIFCEDCGDAYAEYLSESGVCRCERCADAAIAFGRQHMPDAYDDAQ